MGTKIFVNLPVKNLDRSVEFFTKLGFTFNPQFTDEKATCMIIGEDSFVMLLVEDFFKTFIKKEIADATKTTEVLISISRDSRQEVDQMVEKAISAGGKKTREANDHGWMYDSAFEDLDGHIWELAYVDMSAIPAQA